MATVINARGLGCPQPVILTKKALEATAICVIADNDVARENVSRFGRKQGSQVAVEETAAAATSSSRIRSVPGTCPTGIPLPRS